MRPAIPFPADRVPRLPIWAAPMAGGPSTTALLVAVGAAGGLGFVAAGYLTPDDLDRRMAEAAAATEAPWGVNLFLPGPPTADPDGVAAHAAALRPLAERHGVVLGAPRWDDDALDEKLAVVARHRPAVVTCTFGVPDPEWVGRLREATGAAILATATTPDEADRAAAAGVDGLVLQGAEAGGHRAVHVDDPARAAGGPLVGVDALLVAVRDGLDRPLPLVAAGGLATGADVRRVLDAGASAAMLGTAFLATPEAGTSPVHRRALLERRYAETTVTRAFTGRPARSLATPLALAHPAAPAAYPEVHHLTRPLRAAAVRAGDADAVHLWAGTAWRTVTEEPAGTLAARLAREAGL